MVDVFLYSGESNSADVKLSDPTVLRSAGGATYDQVLSVTLSDITVSTSQVLQHSQSVISTLDDVITQANSTLQHSESLALSLDSIQAAFVNTVVHNASIAFSLSDISAAISQALSHNQVINLSLDGISFSGSQILQHSESLSLSLDSIDISLMESVRHIESISITLSDILISISSAALTPFIRRVRLAMYVPAPVPQDPKYLTRYINDELLKIKIAIDVLASGHVDQVYVAPTKPRDGDFRLADGINWNPTATGQGFYGYYNSTWHKLG